MSESKANGCASISHELMVQRLEQSEQVREFFIQMWLQNPMLAKQGGAKVLALLSPIDRTNLNVQVA